MPTEMIAANLGHQRLAGAASGVALTTTAAFTGFIKGTEYIDLIPRNFATAVVARYAMCPYLVVLLSDRATTLDQAPIDFSEVAQDGNAGTPRVLLNSLAVGRYLYIGSAIPFRGFNCDVRAANSTASTAMTGNYWNGIAWTNLSVTDGTSSSVSLDQDGSVTWTMPATGAWRSETLAEIQKGLNLGIADASEQFRWRDVKMYWTRIEWDHALDAATDLDHVLGINQSTAYAEVPNGLGTGMRVRHGWGSNGVGGIEALTNAGTANLLVICSAMNGYFSVGVVN
jgi:hypothetical protein